MGVLLQYFAAIASSLGAFSAGTALGWTSNLQEKVIKGDYGFKVEDTYLSVLGSILNISAACVCILAGYTINKIGRRRTLLLLFVPFTIGWVLMIAAQNVIMLIVGRAFLGIACGGICVAGPVYSGEIAENSIRGTLGSFFQLQITLGILFVYILGAFMSAVMTSLVCGVVPFVFLITVFMCPESPTYHIMKGKQDEAVKSLKRFRGENFDTKAEIESLQKEEQNRQSQNTRAAMKKKSSKKALMISLSLMFFQQLSGINAVIFYTSAIFTDAEIELAPAYATIIVGVVQVFATFSATMTIDKLGRILLLVISDGLMALCTLVLGIFYAIKSSNEDAVKGAGWVSLLALCLFIIAFSLGFGPVPWLMMGEIFSSDVRSLAGSLSGTLNWTLAFVVTMIYPFAREALGPGPCFFFFTAISILGTLFSLFIVPETKGKSRNEIQAMLGDN